MQKSKICFAALLLAATLSTVGCNDNQAKGLNVMDVIINSQPFQPVSVIGIVANVSPYDPKIFTLMDIEDARNKKPSRDVSYLQVICKSRTPKAGEVVKVIEQLMEHGLYVNATKVKR